MSKIGEAFIQFTTKGAGEVRAEFAKVRRSLRGFGRDADQRIGRFGERLDQATEGTRRFQGAIGGVIGVVGIVGAVAFKAGNAIFSLSQALREGSDRAAEFVDSISAGAVRNLAEEADQIEERIDSINQQLAAGGIVNAAERFFSGGAERLRQEKAELERELIARRRSEAGAKERARIAEERELLETARQANETIELEILAARIAAETNAEKKAALEQDAANLRLQQQILQVEKELEAARAGSIGDDDPVVRALIRRKRLLTEANAIELQGIAAARDAALDAERQLRAEREATARAIAEANAKVIEDFRQGFIEAARSINDDRGAFVQLQKLVGSIVDDVKQIRGRI